MSVEDAVYQLHIAVKEGKVDASTAHNIEKVISAPVGSTVYIVPIRFWEEKEPYLGTVVDPVYGSDYRFLMVKPEDDHKMYFDTSRLFLTKKEALAEIEKKNKIRQEKEDKEIEKLLNNIFKKKTIKKPG